MKYLTKEWYALSQQTGLHFGMRVHKDTSLKDENLYLRIYKRKERAFIKMQREVYNVDPRFMLAVEGSVFVPADKFIRGDEINEEDTLVYHLSSEERNRINKLIEEYDSRLPFDEDKCRIEFNKRQELIISDITNKLPKELYSQIADLRVFALGYCTKEILNQLKRLSKKNEKQMNRVLNEYTKAQQDQDIPEKLRKRFGFHDCKVTNFKVHKDIELCMDTSGGFTEYNKIIFHDAKIIKQEKHPVGSTWIYEELYHTLDGYEAHMLLENGGMQEVTISSKDITIDRY